MQNSIAVDVIESNAKKLNKRLLTIHLAAKKIKHDTENDKPSAIKVRLSKLSKIDDQQFIDSMTKEIWQ